MAGTEDTVWFYMQHGHRRGPVTHEKLSEMLFDEQIFLESTQVWKEGMEDWEKIDDCKAFKSTVKKLREKVQKEEAKVRHAITSEGVSEDLIARGASRALFNIFFYLGWMLPVLLGVIILAELQVQQWLSPKTVSENSLQYVIPLLLAALALWQMAVSRMCHAGYSGWHGLGVFVPVWNLYPLFICLLAPQNFKKKKVLGKGAVFYGLLFVAAIALPISGVLPNLTAESLNPIAVTDGINNAYKLETSFNARMKKNVEDNSAAEAKKKAEKEQSPKSSGREGALRERHQRDQ
jgi:hypothetical protein